MSLSFSSSHNIHSEKFNFIFSRNLVISIGKLLLGPTKTFSPSWICPIPQLLLPGQVLQSPDLFHGSPLNSPSLPTPFYATSPRTGCSVLNAAKEAMSSLICWLRQPRMLLVIFAPKQIWFMFSLCLQIPQGLFQQSCSPESQCPTCVIARGSSFPDAGYCPLPIL